MWQQQQVSDFTGNLVIIFSFLALFAMVCAYVYVCSVAVCIIAYESVFVLC